MLDTDVKIISKGGMKQLKILIILTPLHDNLAILIHFSNTTYNKSNSALLLNGYEPLTQIGIVDSQIIVYFKNKIITLLTLKCQS